MGNYNKVLLMGNITRDIEIRHLPTTNNAVAKIGIAVNRKWRDAAGEMKEEVTYVDCDAFGKTAENISKYFSKGKPIFIEGRLRLDTWQDKTDGSNRSKLKVVIDTFEFVEGKGGGGGGPSPDGNGSARPASSPRPATAGARPGPASAQPAYEQIQEDDIPF
jgi:single-strand DNA-binding protein